jgi:hypothetical protein
MSEKIETIVIQTKNGPVTINKSDLKPEHDIFVPEVFDDSAKGSNGPLIKGEPGSDEPTAKPKKKAAK